MTARGVAPGLELSVVAVGLMVGMIVVMWIQRPAASCTLPFEASRTLALSRDVDREHLSADRASADRIALGYMASGANSAEQQGRFVECEGTLLAQIAARHRVSTDQVRAAR
jgi:hypothetical protein